MSRNIKLTLRYDGSAFHGYQYQPNCVTVEQELKTACKRILGEDVKIQSCSRTDTGVHANMFCCNFYTNCDRENSKIILGLNAVLPETIAVYDCEDVDDDFHARYNCKGKEYVYKIWNEKQRNPFYNNYALHFPRLLDENMLNEQAKQFIGTFDFS
ncbi:MAG: tRNA pseudouridine(38-40) synthase TruA, partial [Ruminococcus sp.]|nr:tRNA pseudouridine(38-40) synthase TruA [Ruminococcus sp.]